MPHLGESSTGRAGGTPAMIETRSLFSACGIGSKLKPAVPGFARRRAVPFLLAAVGVWLLVGCIYLPIPEHRSNRHQPDFRDLIGPAGSKARIRPGAITRPQVFALLGVPHYASVDGHSVGYTLSTESGLFIYPQCFSAFPHMKYVYGLRLTFGPNDVLTDWKLDRSPCEAFMWLEPPHIYGTGVEGLNQEKDAPQLLRFEGKLPATRP